MSTETAWNYALGMIQVDGLTPSDELLKLVEMEKCGKITTDDILRRLDEKYSANSANAEQAV